MTYRGRVQNGVVGLEGSPALKEGTVVDVQPLATNERPKRGSAEAIMRHAGIWADAADEVDQLLKELKDMKRAEVEAERAKMKIGPAADIDSE
jgi:hypothetical protein